MTHATLRGGSHARLPGALFATAVCLTLCVVKTASEPFGQTVPPDGFPIVVDFAAFDERGNPVADLRPGEVLVRLGRETASVDALTFLPAASDGNLAAPGSTGQRFGSAEAVDFQRSFLVVIDDESLPQGTEQSTREAVSSFVGSLDARDRIGLATVPHGGVRVPLTTQRVRVVQAVQRVSGRAPGRESANDAACRSRNVLRELDRLLVTLGRTNVPLVVVLFSGSMYDGGGAIEAPLGTFIACDLQLSDFRQVGVRTAQSRSYLYIVQPETFVTAAWSSNPRSGLEHLAGATGGRILQLSGRDLRALDRVKLETSGLYVAHARVQSKPRAATAHAISIRVSRPSVTVAARPQLAVPAESSRSR